jgi:hypothetical protein
MGQRTLVARRRPNGRFDCRYAHWGVTVDPLAQSRPLGRNWSAAAVLAELDASYDRLLVRDERCRWYCVCWLDPTLTDSDDVALARTDDPDSLRGWWTDAKSRAADAVADGTEPAATRATLVTALERRADAVHRLDDASFLRDDR